MEEVSNIHRLQIAQKNMQKAKLFQIEMNSYFFEHAMYDVKDAMSTILAICDVADIKELPEVKRQIMNVNDIISDVSLYNDRSAYNVRHILMNVIKVLERAYRNKISITHRMVSVKAKAYGYQGYLEETLLYMIIEALQGIGEENELKLEIDLSQKGHDAIIAVSFSDYTFSESSKAEILKLGNQGNLKSQFSENKKGLTLSMCIGLTFNEGKEEKDPERNKKPSISLGSLKSKLSLKRDGAQDPA